MYSIVLVLPCLLADNMSPCSGQCKLNQSSMKMQAIWSNWFPLKSVSSYILVETYL